ncbi:hypothetical protein EGR_07751 [Echinococcus granulosus]|uniref:Uncharacterized protein n=1 Tax=Echinococcus granulosus TaxID=6210 RepID=W6U7Z9_ECHGR|nr:hypothetical protein EGR_07751 [Echinococcus granulosus]EUB57358.1 hypothetical protein EGR_07751 [Echinococcus granulosus]
MNSVVVNDSNEVCQPPPLLLSPPVCWQILIRLATTVFTSGTDIRVNEEWQEDRKVDTASGIGCKISRPTRKRRFPLEPDCYAHFGNIFVNKDFLKTMAEKGNLARRNDLFHTGLGLFSNV